MIDAIEYDLLLEFEDRAELGLFIGLVNRYAKKDYTDEPGLISRAWWIPFYCAPLPFPGGKQLEVLLVLWSGFQANLICLPSDADRKERELMALETDWEVERYPLWVNPSFYRGQYGDYR